jgi:hypothetical protein
MARMTPEQLKARLDKLSIRIVPAVAAGMKLAAANVEGRAKVNCTPGESPYYKAPFDQGYLRKAMAHEVVVAGRSVYGHIGNGMDYSTAVHEGTSRMQGRPFMLDAIISERETTAALLSEALNDEMEAV